LPAFGWDPVVLTVKDINYLVYDYSLLREIPAEAQIVATESLDPQRLSVLLWRQVRERGEGSRKDIVRNGYFVEGSRILQLYRRMRDFLTFPDLWLGWIPFAYRAGVQAIQRERIDAILAMLGPSSTAILARLLSRKTGVPYVMDLRDGWTDDPDVHYPTALHRRGQAILERWAVDGAAALTVYGEECCQSFGRRYPNIAGRIQVLTNGFDEADLENVTPKKRSEGKHRLVYMGSLNAYAEQSFLTFLDAMRKLSERIRDSIEVLFIGRAYVQAPGQAAAAGLEKHITFIPYLPHVEALSYLLSADATLLFIRKGDFVSLTGKLFEYLMVGRPVLACIEPEGECAALLRRTGHSRWITPPDNSQRISEAMTALAEAGWPKPEFSQVQQFSRKGSSQKLAALLEKVANERAVPASGTHSLASAAGAKCGD
jgi:glycosyltransferase involved in cell wall biosynthesis